MSREMMRFSGSPNPFHVRIFQCQSLACECGSLTLDVQEFIDSDPPARGDLAFSIQIRIATWEEIDPPARSPQEAAIVEEFLRDYPADERAELQRDCEEKLRRVRLLKEHLLEPREVRQGGLVCFSELLSRPDPENAAGRLYTFFDEFEKDGVVYAVDDCYCSNPDCDCRSVELAFVRINDPGTLTGATWLFQARLSFRGRVETIDCEKYSRREAESLLAAWRKKYGDDFVEFKERYDLVKAMGRRSLAQQPSAVAPRPSVLVSTPRPTDAHELLDPVSPAMKTGRVGRNDPCPCGSGKKFKKCCALKPQPEE